MTSHKIDLLNEIVQSFEEFFNKLIAKIICYNQLPKFLKSFREIKCKEELR